MSIMSAVDTPLRCSGIPSLSSVATVSVEDADAVLKAYWCTKGHNFDVVFASHVDLPMFWECEEHEIVAFEC